MRSKTRATVLDRRAVEEARALGTRAMELCSGRELGLRRSSVRWSAASPVCVNNVEKGSSSRANVQTVHAVRASLCFERAAFFRLRGGLLLPVTRTKVSTPRVEVW